MWLRRDRRRGCSHRHLAPGDRQLVDISSTQEARLQSTRSSNLPRVEAEKAVTEAKEALAAAEGSAKAECSRALKGADPRGPACKSLEQREQAARQRVVEARAGLVGLGAQTVENPAALAVASIDIGGNLPVVVAVALASQARDRGTCRPRLRLRADAPQGGTAEDEDEAAKEKAAWPSEASRQEAEDG